MTESCRLSQCLEAGCCLFFSLSQTSRALTHARWIMGGDFYQILPSWVKRIRLPIEGRILTFNFPMGSTLSKLIYSRYLTGALSLQCHLAQHQVFQSSLTIEARRCQNQHQTSSLWRGVPTACYGRSSNPVGHVLNQVFCSFPMHNSWNREVRLSLMRSPIH